MMDFIEDYPGTSILLACGAIVLGVTSCVNSDAYREYIAAKEKQDVADAVPRVVREVDGCKVYAFKSTNWHYFTRCPVETTTDTGITVVEHHGKTTSSHVEYDSIVTNNVKELK